MSMALHFTYYSLLSTIAQVQTAGVQPPQQCKESGYYIPCQSPALSCSFVAYGHHFQDPYH
jgi:hypothetical protein